ncbi:hypothetical protein [Bacteroides xylanisolvens]|uniref:hypothetical protein n=1 Tax=Bacteroides xylanisolvens TaxID=371601 RepID=UPI00356736F8
MVGLFAVCKVASPIIQPQTASPVFYILPIRVFHYRTSAILAGEILYAKIQRSDGRQVTLR